MIKCPGCGEDNPPKFRLCGYCGTPLAAPSAPLPVHEVRKTVTVVFSDLKDSTALGERLDAEALHEVKERYFSAMAAEIARHGGKIEKYIGDAIMAVFGLPRAHEDDALRAVRAAVGMHEALARVNADVNARYGVVLAHRTGVNTGEVVANDDPGANQKLATGDAVNIAARLEQAAPANEIYLGEVTWRLVRDAVEVEPVEPLELKGKAQRVSAFRLVSAAGLDGNLRRVDTPIVGRDAELAEISRIYREVADGRTVRLVTVFGDAGVGKSRLVHEVVERIAQGARVLRGRCLAYGEGITFWPLRVMLAAAGVRDDDSPETAHARLLASIGDREVVDRLAAAVGLSSATYPMHETAWAARKALEILAAEGPVVALVDDIHWAEGAFLDVLEHVLDNSRDVPILLLATSRHDLREERPQWGQRERALNVVLKPLEDGAAAQVVSNLLGNAELPAEVTRRIVQAAEGNPLYVEQMLSMLIDSGALLQRAGRWLRADEHMAIHVPPTIHALLEARLDRLGRAERAAMEPAAVIGLEFEQPAVRSLAPEAIRPAMHEHLATLTAKQFIRVSRAVEAEPIYRFHHQLVRDTVYNALLKRARATMHVEFVRWADKINADRDRAREFEEILGYHLEQAYRYLCELGPLDDIGVAVGKDGSARLARAARRAFGRGDVNAAANLYRRACTLLPQQSIERLALLPTLGEVLMELGDFDGARQTLDEAASQASRDGQEGIEAHIKIMRMLVRMYSGEPGNWGTEAQQLAQACMPILEREGMHSQLANAWRLSGMVDMIAARYGRIIEAVEKSIAHARLAGDARMVSRSSVALSSSALAGPTPVPKAIELCQQLIDGSTGDRQAEGSVLCICALLRAMNGEFAAARALYRRGRSMLSELGQGVLTAATGMEVARVEMLAGELPEAERVLRTDLAFLKEHGETYFSSTMSAFLAQVLLEQGRSDEAMEFTIVAESTAATDDIETQVLWRSIRAQILATDGKSEMAYGLARVAVELSLATDGPSCKAGAHMALASVCRSTGRPAEARAALDEAVGYFRLKEERVSLEKALRLAQSL